MRFMMIVKATPESEAGAPPSRELIAAMGRFNEQMAKAGVLLAAEGLHPTSRGARVHFSGDKRTLIDGPFTETKELIAGFWLIQVKSREEAMEWAMRCPAPHENTECDVEIRQIFELEDFPADVLPREEAQREQALRDELEQKASKR